MDMVDGDLHGIKWQDDLNATFHQNSFGRSGLITAEGHQFPTSSIVAGYGKSEQIQRQPFRTYYSELDRLVEGSDAVLVLGFSFIDAHLRQAFGTYRDGRDRPVVLIDYADDDAMTAGSTFGVGNATSVRAMHIFSAHPSRMKWLGGRHPDTVKALRDAREFERCSDPCHRLSLWYNGMLEACRYAEKVLKELR